MKFDEFLESYKKMYKWRHDVDKFIKEEKENKRMIVREDYVTNSSSANFILTLIAETEDTVTFKAYLLSYLNEWKEDISYLAEKQPWLVEQAEEAINSIQHVAGNVFKVRDYTVMLNSLANDMPQWMVNLILLHAQKDLLRFGIRDLHLEIEKD